MLIATLSTPQIILYPLCVLLFHLSCCDQTVLWWYVFCSHYCLESFTWNEYRLAYAWPSINIPRICYSPLFTQLFSLNTMWIPKMSYYSCMGSGQFGGFVWLVFRYILCYCLFRFFQFCQQMFVESSPICCTVGAVSKSYRDIWTSRRDSHG